MEKVKVFTEEDDGDVDKQDGDKDFEGGDKDKNVIPSIPELSKDETAKIESMVKSIKDEKMFSE